MDSQKITHESYGQISFSRVSGKKRFYGSELSKGSYIELEIAQSEVERTLSKDWFYCKNAPLVKIRLTQNQFSELITSLNIGEGVPCTIEKIGDRFMEGLPLIENRKDYVSRVFKERMITFSKKLKLMQERAKNLISKKTLSKDDQYELRSSIEWLTTEVETNIPFFADCFQENMDKVVVEAKMEIEAAITNKILSTGLSSLQLGLKDNLKIKE